MKFLLNMNIQPSLANLLDNEGFPSRHVRDIGLAKADDQSIVEEAKRQDEIIITHDLDYGHLLAFSGESKPSVIIYRIANNSLENLFSRFQKSFKQIEA
ncbi:MAG: hypothetical protein A2161_17195, partial [Candidatus Schekmanbacteria bacterium RBG_13_48_7]